MDLSLSLSVLGFLLLFMIINKPKLSKIYFRIHFIQIYLMKFICPLLNVCSNDQIYFLIQYLKSLILPILTFFLLFNSMSLLTLFSFFQELLEGYFGTYSFFYFVSLYNHLNILLALHWLYFKFKYLDHCLK